MSAEALTRFMGWALVFNIGLLLIFFTVATVFKGPIARLNAKMFGVSEKQARNMMFRLFYQYRILFAFFVVIPWLILVTVW